MKLCLASGLAAAVLLGGCGQSCADLPGLRAERDALRSSYLELARSGAPPARTQTADERLHAVERQVFDLEKACGAR